MSLEAKIGHFFQKWFPQYLSTHNIELLKYTVLCDSIHICGVDDSLDFPCSGTKIEYYICTYDQIKSYQNELLSQCECCIVSIFPVLSLLHSISLAIVLTRAKCFSFSFEKCLYIQNLSMLVVGKEKLNTILILRMSFCSPFFFSRGNSIAIVWSKYFSPS